MAQGSSWSTTSPTRRPRVWHTWRDSSPSTVRLHRLFGVIFLNDCRDRITVFVYCASSHTPVLSVLSCAPDHSMAPLARLVAWLACSSSASTSATTTTATLRAATTTTTSSHPSLWLPRQWHKGLSSVVSSLADFFSSPSGSQISDKSHNQETTDLHKCISRIHRSTSDHEKTNLCVLVTGALGGRFDHEAANINILYLFSDMRIVLLSDDCLIRLLPKTHKHDIYIESSVEGPHCGLFPVGAPSGSTTTTGLKWNLSEAKMRFGSMISTSNIVHAEKGLGWNGP
uniref:thiamine diphosphokinase n=1 Tax=Leersia perrieri TaxID=77586 RepID=A0A0D9V0S7_9ORYZ